ncbi:hypothetical protein CASFOL_035380 [Castilleja foliolosa]|uniref:Arabidopsis retrotransposon Orf1 C-terminal domain-containing protein n=1 Tax=Castilleja foliolosa TaxID=1961234 RepID=A0ABD3BSN2_9LAMI
MVHSPEEDAYYRKFKSIPITEPRCIDWKFLDHVGGGLADKIREYLDKMGLEKFANIEYGGYKLLCLEFLSTFNWNKNKNSVKCRLLGQELEITLDVMEEVFDFPKCVSSDDNQFKDFNTKDELKELSGFDNWCSSGMSSEFIQDHALAVLHKLLSYSIVGKQRVTNVNTLEVYLFSSVKHGKGVCPL